MTCAMMMMMMGLTLGSSLSGRSITDTMIDSSPSRISLDPAGSDPCSYASMFSMELPLVRDLSPSLNRHVHV